MSAVLEPYAVYDRFAWYYCRGWGNDFHAQVRPMLEREVFPRLREGARVLDLCCGTGDLTAYLVEHGYDVTGIEGSCEMLRYAREKVPAATFIHADAREFAAPPEFDAALSTFDSLNHVLAIEDLERVFQNVGSALLPGGLFVFDLNMEEAFRTNWRGAFAYADEASAGITRGSYDPEKRIGRAEITLFRHEGEGVWRRSETLVEERCYSEDEVLAALRRAGFQSIETREGYELGLKNQIGLGREFFFATR